ncbi:hypothetical protein [Roseibium sp.]|uniref:hypothetical protein n=1 Tax=Roseibium sp. TaxID=1936156 RepID=UPI003BB15F83
MTSDPTLFTSIEWVLLAMAALVSLTMFALFYRSDPDFPFAEQEENWARDRETPGETPCDGTASANGMTPRNRR